VAHFDRWDVCAAWYCFAVNYHEGQYTKTYRILGRLKRLHVKLPASVVDRQELEANAAEIYLDLAAAQDSNVGYLHCACRDCFEIVIGYTFCDTCQVAECGINLECRVEPTECGDHEPN
jgi:hypothetical protein